MECFVCKMPDINDEQYGEMYTVQDIRCHYFCLLFSNIPQKGEDNEGILGFKYRDIKQTVASNKMTCFYCKKPYATTVCYRKHCSIKYHFICGIKNNCLFRFLDGFSSYCTSHTMLPKNPPKTFDPERICLICTEKMGPYHSLESIPIHCNPKSHVHRKCLQTFALQAGHGLKCLICRDERMEANMDFKKYVRQRGVFVPEREIQWMLNQCEDGSQDPSAQPLMCMAKVCKNGERHFPVGTPVGATCFHCKSVFHKDCRQYSVIKKNGHYICFDCFDEDIDEIPEVMADAINQEMVPFQVNEENVEMKRFLADAYQGNTNHVQENILPNFHGPKSAEVGKFRLNYFFNSHNPHN